ncbi:chymotrypsin inhibitor isoform X2 [Megalopta genalis]|uniref:chymotrypsin inhibitor isoform X2 n=1 Tax=Megalopta genalis TaxID=115081 RepID=UPI003FD66112
MFKMFKFLVAMTMLAVVIAESFADSLVECPNNEHWSLCGTLCEPSCELPKPNPFFCPRIECARDTAGCRCKNGYVRNEDNKDCVALKECPHKSQSKAI